MAAVFFIIIERCKLNINVKYFYNNLWQYRNNEGIFLDYNNRRLRCRLLRKLTVLNLVIYWGLLALLESTVFPRYGRIPMS